MENPNPNKDIHEKLKDLRSYLRSLGSVAVAFSSGVDSTFLLKVAHDELGDKAVAVTASSCSFPSGRASGFRVFVYERKTQRKIRMKSKRRNCPD